MGGPAEGRDGGPGDARVVRGDEEGRGEKEGKGGEGEVKKMKNQEKRSENAVEIREEWKVEEKEGKYTERELKRKK